MSHVAALSAVAFSPDCRTLYSGSTDGRLHAWDADSGVRLAEFVQHERAILDLSFTLDNRLLSASRDGTIVEWMERGAPARTDRRHTGGVYAVIADSTGIVSCSHDRTISASGIVLRGHRDTVTGVVRCGSSLLSAARDCTLKRWDVATGREAASRVAHDRWVTKLRAAGSDACVTVSEDGTVACWNASSLELRWKKSVHPSLPPVWGLDVSRDGTLAVTGGPTAAQLWHVADGTRGHIFPQPPLANRACAFSPDGRLLALGCDDGSLSVFETATARLRWRAPGNALGILSAAATSEGRRIAIGRTDGFIEVRDGEGMPLRSFRGHERFVYLMRPLGDRRFVSGAFDGWLNVFSYEDLDAPLRLHHGRGFVFGVAICRNAGLIVSSGGDVARVWRLDGGAHAADLPIASDGVHNFVTADDDATTIVTGNEAGVLRVWRRNGDRFGKSRSFDLELATDQLCALTQTIDGKIVAATAGGNVVVADLQAERVLARHACLEDWIRELRTSPEGEVLALAQDTTFECVRIDDGAPVPTPMPKTRTAAVAHLADGAFAAVRLDGTVEWRGPVTRSSRAGI